MKDARNILTGFVVIPGLVFFYGSAHPVETPVLVDSVRAQSIVEATPAPGEVDGPARITSIVTTWGTPIPTPKPVTVREKIANTFGDSHIMDKVAFCESSYNPKAAHSVSSAKGVFQIIRGTFKGNNCDGDPLNADDNIKCAKKIYDRRGLQPWDASKHCWAK